MLPGAPCFHKECDTPAPKLEPRCHCFAEADEMIESCRRNNVIFALACHKNWSPWFQSCRNAIEKGEIGKFRSMVCNFGWSLSRGHSHTLSLFRMFADAPVEIITVLACKTLL